MSKNIKQAAGAVVKKTESANAVQVYDYGEFAGAGFDNMSREDFAVPFIYLLQANSKYLSTTQNADARPGMLLNTVSEEVYPAEIAKGGAGLIFVPFFRERHFVEWRPRDSGGGFVAQHAPDHQFVLDAKANQKFGEFSTPTGNDLIETFYVYGLHVKDMDEAIFEPAIQAFNSTKIKVYKQWMTRADSLRVATPKGRVQPPLWAHAFRFQTVGQKKGNDHYFNFQIGFANENAENSRLAPDHPVFRAAADLWQEAREGKLRAATETLNREPGEESDADIREVF